MAYEWIKKEKEVEICGWAEQIRILGSIAFIILRDRNGTIQLIFKKKENPKLFEKVKKITAESFINAKGEVILNEKARNGFEIKVNEFEIVNKSEAIPMDVSGKIESEMATRFDYRFLDLRIRKNYLIFVLRSKIIKYFNEYFQNNGFIAINTPKITLLGAESGAELFKLDYFGEKAFLAQSPQIYKQMMQAAGFWKVYEIGPVFRAEKSHTTRHLTEFTGVDMEMSFCKHSYDNLFKIMNVLEELMKYTIDQLKTNDKELIKELNITFNVPKKFPIVEFYKAKGILKEEYNKKIEDDFDNEAESMLGEYALKKFNSDFIFITNYPKTERPFYHMQNPDGKTTASFDLLYKGQEIVTGSLREFRYEVLKKQAQEFGLSPEQLKDYLQIFLYGTPPHGGFGMGLDRVVQKMIPIKNVKEAVLFPRDPERVRP